MKIPAFLGIDTSNYTTSVSLATEKDYFQQRQLLPVELGQLGLRQSDAVFCHVKILSELIKKLMDKNDIYEIKAVGVSAYPRDCENSYMPCFLVGKMAAESIAAVLNVPVYLFSHQAGHIAASLYSSGKRNLIDSQFFAFHISGGTTECVKVDSLTQGKIEIISSSNDLHAGQVVDRCANMLGLSFPGGKELDKLSLESTEKFNNKIILKNGNPCFSGIENQCRDMLKNGYKHCDIAKFALDSILVGIKGMVDYARSKNNCESFVFAGGVMCNTILRRELSKYCNCGFASVELSCDNSVGIAYLAMNSYSKGV